MKAAVIGCGAQGRGGHVANYAKMEEVSLVAVCDVNFERAQAVAKEFKCSARIRRLSRNVRKTRPRPSQRLHTPCAAQRSDG